MKARLAAAITAALVTSTAGTAAFAHDDGKGNPLPPPLEQQQREAEGVVASNANEKSNAPRGFAPCKKGMAAKTYPCKKVDMMSHLTLADLGLSYANDIWGWVDPATGDEYALVGGIEGTVFVDITDPKRPDVVGTLPTHTTFPPPRLGVWRDIKVHDNHAYVVAENAGHGMQVFDLTRLRGVEGEPRTFDEDADYQEFGNAHNVNINEDSGFAYVVGTNTCAGGLHMVDVRDPAQPTFAGCYGDDGYIHDTQCVTYDGPDKDYRGREICVNSAATFTDFTPEGIVNTVTVADVTNKANPVSVDSFEYPEDGYSHQGWLTPDQRYFLHNDELDEFGHGFPTLNTTTRIFDLRNLDDIGLTATTDNGQTSIGHNLYTEGKRAYASNYTSGLRVFDTTKVAAGRLPELGFFDVYPANDNNAFEGGTWSNYPYYDSRSVAVSSIDNGLFVLKPRGNLG